MVGNDTMIKQLSLALQNETGVDDITLVEYIWNLRSQGEHAVRQELSSFKPTFVEKIVSILGLTESVATGLQKGRTYNAQVEAITPQGVMVKLGNQSSEANSGLIDRSEFVNGVNISEGEYLIVFVRNIRADKTLELKLVADNDSRGYEDEHTNDEFEIQQLQASGNHQGSYEPQKRPFSSIDVVVERKIPNFLHGEIDTDFFHSHRVNGTNPQKHWLEKSAEHTSSKVFEASSNTRRQRDEIANLDSNNSKRHNNTGKSREKKSYLKNPTTKNSLPVHAFRSDILESVAESPVVIIVGDTGSGKTTQITQFLHGAGYSRNGKVIACTQPRRLAAISIAQRVAYELNAGTAGQTVGYSVRFDDCTSPETEVKYMTDGILMREIISDPDLSEYSVIMLDEAHERTIATDVLFGLLKGAVARRPDLRVIVASATLDAERFAIYFGNAPILRIPGRTFPVAIEWAPEPILDYMEAALMKVKEIHDTNTSRGEAGDILVFLTGQAEIDLATSAIAQSYPQGDLIPIPVYAAIPSELQSLIFEPAPVNKRKVVFATNIAETSLTIDGIRFVVDPGFSKIQVWDANQGMGTLRVQPISQAQANQRSGRAGRTAPGICYRLYTKRSFENEMDLSTTPEIRRSNLGHMVLLLKSMGIKDILKFDFMDSPPKASLIASLHDLFILGAVDDNAELTTLGHRMARFPLDPALAKVLISALQQGKWFLQDMLTIIAMLSMPSVFYRPARPAQRKAEADQAHRQFHDISGDHLTLLNVYNKWIASGCSKKWSDSHFLQHRNLVKVKDARKQLEDLVGKGSKQTASDSRGMPSWKTRKEHVLKTLCSGYFQNVAKIGTKSLGVSSGDYTTLSIEANVSIHPSSVLYRKNASYVIYNSLMLTSKEYMHVVSEIRPEWLPEAAPHYWKRADKADVLKRQRVETLKPLHNKHASHENEWRVSEQRKTLFSGKRR